jgi:hypothetical protein
MLGFLGGLLGFFCFFGGRGCVFALEALDAAGGGSDDCS